MAVNCRQITPPAALEPLHPHSTASSVSSKGRSSRNVSPRSVNTHETTPPQSPRQSSKRKSCNTSPRRYNGPQLLPRVRTQDQVINVSSASPTEQYRTTSVASAGYSISNSAYNSYYRYEPQPYTWSASPTGSNMLTPISANPVITSYNPSPLEYDQESQVEWSIYQQSQPQAALKPQRTHSRYASQTQFRPSSKSSQYYENSSGYEANGYAHPATFQPTSIYDTAEPYRSVAPPQMTVSLADTEPEPTREAAAYSSTTQSRYEILSKFDFDQYPEDVERVTLMEYLTMPNPSPDLIRRLPESRHDDVHFWWDARNIKQWKDFNLSTIRSIPGFTQLLERVPFPSPSLPKPRRGNSHPETITDLRDVHSAYYVTKLNAALEACLGVPTMRIHTSTSGRTSGPKSRPDFYGFYENDEEHAVIGSGKSRVVGLVKAYEQWNTGMVSEERKRATYRRELAHLHQHMRDHETRYGFIINEIEVVCVRNGTDETPYFGFLELAPPVMLSAHGPGQLTACLALWYLHMLAKNIPLPGQCKWRTDIGRPTALTRSKHLPRDEKQPQVQAIERRTAIRNRGWVFPSDPLSRMEKGKQKRTRTKAATSSSSSSTAAAAAATSSRSQRS